MFNYPENVWRQRNLMVHKLLFNPFKLANRKTQMYLGLLPESSYATVKSLNVFEFFWQKYRTSKSSNDEFAILVIALTWRLEESILNSLNIFKIKIYVYFSFQSFLKKGGIRKYYANGMRQRRIIKKHLKELKYT